MLQVNDQISIPMSCIEISAIRSQGAGGQHVNKNATGIHLRMFIPAAPLPEAVKSRLFQLKDYRISSDGWIVIKAQRFRSQEQNKSDALNRLRDLIIKATIVPKTRRATKPTRGSKERRIQTKKKRSDIKSRRRKIDGNDLEY